MMILTDILSSIGNFGPFILFIFSLYLLRKTPNALYYYLIGFLLNMILNIILKLTFKQPRPKDNEDLFKLTLNYASKYNSVLPFDIYGMPSGHAESVIFSTIFIHLMFNNLKLTLLYLFISMITIFQRVIELYHTIFQVIVGFFVGLIFGYFIFFMYKQKMTGNLALKKDDYALILFN
jgi:membrane-associated phospholipid phosphatase